MPNNLSYDARQVSAQNTQKLVQRITITTYELIKALVDFIGHMVKVFLAK
ncbi:hypothetical protein H3C70_01670 [Patescibacteria group bacterium]|nr:hypothetical protein [Patescibacteria group bacterium]